MDESGLKIESDETPLRTAFNEPYYFVMLLEGEAWFSVDFNTYRCQGTCIVFLSPYQLLKLQPEGITRLTALRFHGDYYCIEYHKEEVACNGILFNNIYEKPYIIPSASLKDEIINLFQRLKPLQNSGSRTDVAVARSYLQLILALCSREKTLQHTSLKPGVRTNKPGMPDFNEVLERHFTSSKSVAFYADLYHLSADAFSKKIKKHFGKSPSTLIRERMVLEAKKKLHLTYKSIREVAHELGFEDEFYFSRYFKKAVGVSPATFRDQVGISIVAKKSMQSP